MRVEAEKLNCFRDFCSHFRCAKQINQIGFSLVHLIFVEEIAQKLHQKQLNTIKVGRFLLLFYDISNRVQIILCLGISSSQFDIDFNVYSKFNAGPAMASGTECRSLCHAPCDDVLLLFQPEIGLQANCGIRKYSGSMADVPGLQRTIWQG